MAEAESTVTQDSNGPNSGRRSGRRSPNFPYVDLPTAIQRIEQIYEHEGRNAAPISIVAQHWSYSPTSSSTDKVVGALNAYGLIRSEGAGDDRMISLTERALTIIEDETDDRADRQKAIREAAVDPVIFADIRAEFGANLPSDGNLRTWLVRQRNYSQNAGNAVISNYRATIEYAGLDSVASTGDNDRKPKLDEQVSKKVEMGCFVQWTSQGVARFEQPRKVLALSDDGAFAFVEGTETGLPVEQLSVEKSPMIASPNTAQEASQITPPPNPFFKPIERTTGLAQETSQIGASKAMLTWPEKMTAEEYDDLEYWLKGVLRKAKRSVGETDDDPAE